MKILQLLLEFIYVFVDNFREAFISSNDFFIFSRFCVSNVSNLVFDQMRNEKIWLAYDNLMWSLGVMKLSSDGKVIYVLFFLLESSVKVTVPNIQS